MAKEWTAEEINSHYKDDPRKLIGFRANELYTTDHTNKQSISGNSWEYALFTALTEKMNLTQCLSGPYNMMKKDFYKLLDNQRYSLLLDAKDAYNKLCNIDGFFTTDGIHGTILFNPQNKTDARDIIIIGPTLEERGISAKNNSKSVRSQRISVSDPDFLSKITKGTLVSTQTERQQIITAINQISPMIGDLWRNHDNIKQQIYEDLCSVLYTQLSKYAANNISAKITNSQNLFYGIFGIVNDYYHILKMKNSISVNPINCFGTLPQGTIIPTNMKISQPTNKKIQIDFNNNYSVFIRPHSASSKISTSLKMECELK